MAAKVDRSFNEYEFLERHQLRQDLPLGPLSVYIEALAQTHSVHGRERAETSTEEDFRLAPATGFVFHLLTQAYEQLQAAIVVKATRGGAAVVALARAAVELSVSIQYLMAEQTEGRLLAWFENYLQSDLHSLTGWHESAQRDSQAAPEHVPAIAERAQFLMALQGKVAGMREDFVELGLPVAVSSWPTLAERFKAVDELGFHSWYARMSPATEFAVEDLLNRVALSPSGEHALQVYDQEAAWYEGLALCLAVKSWLRASLAIAHRYSLPNTLACIQAQSQLVDAELVRLGTQKPRAA
jgi:hypothetical protein